MSPRPFLGYTDYFVLGVSLIIPVVIGLKFRNSGGKHASVGEYFLAGRKAGMFPVVMSASVTCLSAILMIGTPAEVYKYGPIFVYRTFTMALGQIVAGLVFLPVYFQCGISSIYEYLEIRYGKFTRYAISTIFLLQMVLYMCSVKLGPVLALNTVTEFSVEAAIIVLGAVCTFYCVVGGLKAVLWGDVFQSGLMFACLIAVYAVGISEVGGFGEVKRRASAGQRLDFFDFSFDFVTRYTIWNSLARGFTYGVGYYGTNQMEVQRWLSMSSCNRAQRAIKWNILPVFCLQFLATMLGIIIFAVFYLCDPILMSKETGISKYDQIVPYFIISRLHSIPGLTGLCIAGIFSGSLSTMSSALNSLATVTMVDFVQPAFPALTKERTIKLSKLLGLFYGLLCIGVTFIISKTHSILQTVGTFSSFNEGPVLAIFFIGVLTRKASDKAAFVGLLVGVCIVGWVGLGAMYGGFRYPTLPLETSGCPALQNGTAILSSNSAVYIEKLLAKNNEVFPLYKISFIWIPALGFLCTVLSVFIASLFFDRNKNVIPSDSICLSPVVRWWMKSSPKEETNDNIKEMETKNTEH
ncbi:hypothetical protein JTE90_018944 [Oedothorax gibbosus]|uniref:Sodium/solute symporter n=1 Tax=Oedothorax gibbosus TaxID=931172 RepID=A0AAV6TX38_9ARAC|nr:hypothetical protein JTE90_018944 [Oedothorax gibbosus]